MQTFLPYPDFAASAAVLDGRRLGKQRVEALQVLRALTWTTYGWKRHPAVRMWAGYPDAVAAYGLAVCAEWTGRGRQARAAQPGRARAALRAAGVARRRARAPQPPLRARAQGPGVLRAAVRRRRPGGGLLLAGLSRAGPRTISRPAA